jgi:hypothetical protein
MLPRVPVNMHNKAQRALPPPQCTKCKYTTLSIHKLTLGHLCTMVVPPDTVPSITFLQPAQRWGLTSAHSRLAPYVYPHERLQATKPRPCYHTQCPCTLSVRRENRLQIASSPNIHNSKLHNNVHIEWEPPHTKICTHLWARKSVHVRELSDSTQACRLVCHPLPLLFRFSDRAA